MRFPRSSWKDREFYFRGRVSKVRESTYEQTSNPIAAIASGRLIDRVSAKFRYIIWLSARDRASQRIENKKTSKTPEYIVVGNSCTNGKTSFFIINLSSFLISYLAIAMHYIPSLNHHPTNVIEAGAFTYLILIFYFATQIRSFSCEYLITRISAFFSFLFIFFSTSELRFKSKRHYQFADVDIVSS